MYWNRLTTAGVGIQLNDGEETTNVKVRHVRVFKWKNGA
jgi:hypothetical protein